MAWCLVKHQEQFYLFLSILIMSVHCRWRLFKTAHTFSNLCVNNHIAILMKDSV
jgi:hypothetical protein